MVHAQIIEKNDTKVYNSGQEDENLYNVYVVLLDSHSSNQGTRNLPKTMHFLEKSMQAISFPYINKVGRNSMPNAVAMWFGKRMEKVDGKPFNLPDTKADWTFDSFCHRYIDNETFIFKEFSAEGYKFLEKLAKQALQTMLAEDWMQGVLNWPGCWGIKTEYFRPFQVALEEKAAVLLKRTYSRSNCIEPHQDILRYLENFINSYNGVPKFGWIWLSLLGHDHESGTIHADPDFQRFLLRNKKKVSRAVPMFTAAHLFGAFLILHETQ
ncbi:hypothetical protein OESDEN_02121 [Oesophagostomum dentatum]|uniref:Uncharacterized protein n=1 Tax=Oesophagostomum dentatum TaxID=61180 RepID=A0A0B1TR67_OESDE|nr:hypothetical protein OESDEN_02121 [Oesophagostomum dentatum]